MFVKLKTGRRAGEIVEMKFEDARALIDNGAAERAYQDSPAPAETPAPRSQTPIPAPRQKKRGPR